MSSDAKRRRIFAAVSITVLADKTGVSVHPCKGLTEAPSAKNGSARFAVTDFGNGIPEEDLPYIWDRYYTARNRKNKAIVSGLGLSIAKEILTAHQAEFGVESREQFRKAPNKTKRYVGKGFIRYVANPAYCVMYRS